MSAAAQSRTPTTDPSPPPAAASIPTALGRVLAVVRRLIDYGGQLAATLQQRAAAPDFALYARRFGTADLAVILARITGGLRRAFALEVALCRRAARGRDLTPTPVRMPAAPGLRLPRQSAPPDPQATGPTEDPRLAHLPTEAEIAAELRRRPVGAVIADICRDLGARPGDFDRAFWDELALAIITYGGSLTCFLGNLSRQISAFNSGNHSDRADPIWPAAPPLLPSPTTGPPWSRPRIPDRQLA